MQEEAGLKQSLFEYRQKLTLLHCISEVTCVSVQRTEGRCHGHRGTGWSCSVTVVGIGAGRGPQLHLCLPILQAAPGPPPGPLNSSCLVKHISSALKAATYLDSKDFLITNDTF